MAQADYYVTKPFLVLGNTTAGELPAVAGATMSIYYKNGEVDSSIKILAGTFLAFRDVDHINMDTVDYGNLSKAEYLDRQVSFFLR